jgi:hypothetical protein
MKKTDFTPEEWSVLYSAPSLAGMVVSASSPSGPIGLMKEMFSVGMAVAESAKQKPSNPLIQALIEDMKQGGTKPPRPEGVGNMEQARAYGLGQLQKAADILAQKNAGPVGDEFRAWLVDTARRVAAASNEGGFLGFGGVRVTPQEEEAIKQIASTLRVG